ncbi:MAG: hypothetical protein E4H14_10890, partial [Candidatus Thorarchaeota archaeon]
MKVLGKAVLICLLITNVVFYLPQMNELGASDEFILPNNLEFYCSPSQDPDISRNFWAYDFDLEEYYEIESTLLTSGEYCLFYMQDSMISQIGAAQAQSLCEMYKDEFDTLIYPTVVEFAGNPNGTLGDIDGDPRIIILINDNWVSYYSQRNEIVTPYSNQCEMVYIYYPSSLIIDTIAHEFCHLVCFNYEFDEVHFILEGLAEYATYQCGYLEPYGNESRRTSYFLDSPNDPLIYFDVAARDYGGSYLFSFYLAEQFGTQFLSDLIQHEDDGARGIETALDEAGYNITFNQLYLDWITALTINELGFDDNKYGFQNLDVKIEDITVVDDIPFVSESMDVWCYGSNIFELAESPNGFTITTGIPSSGKIGLSVAYHDVDGWHVTQEISTMEITENVHGNNIDSAYVIVTYF